MDAEWLCEVVVWQIMLYTLTWSVICVSAKIRYRICKKGLGHERVREPYHS
jgi:hypothetical protein